MNSTVSLFLMQMVNQLEMGKHKNCAFTIRSHASPIALHWLPLGHRKRTVFTSIGSLSVLMLNHWPHPQGMHTVVIATWDAISEPLILQLHLPSSPSLPLPSLVFPQAREPLAIESYCIRRSRQSHSCAVTNRRHDHAGSPRANYGHRECRRYQYTYLVWATTSWVYANQSHTPILPCILIKTVSS